MYVNSQDENVEREEVEVIIKKATIKLTIDEDRISTESDQIAGKLALFVLLW